MKVTPDHAVSIAIYTCIQYTRTAIIRLTNQGAFHRRQSGVQSGHNVGPSK